MSTTDDITKAIADIGKFWGKPAQVTPIEEIGDIKRASLQKLVNIFS